MNPTTLLGFNCGGGNHQRNKFQLSSNNPTRPQGSPVLAHPGHPVKNTPCQNITPIFKYFNQYSRLGALYIYIYPSHPPRATFWFIWQSEVPLRPFARGRGKLSPMTGEQARLPYAGEHFSPMQGRGVWHARGITGYAPLTTSLYACLDCHYARAAGSRCLPGPPRSVLFMVPLFSFLLESIGVERPNLKTPCKPCAWQNPSAKGSAGSRSTPY